MPRHARIVTWNGKDVPSELRELPAGGRGSNGVSWPPSPAFETVSASPEADPLRGAGCQLPYARTNRARVAVPIEPDNLLAVLSTRGRVTGPGGAAALLGINPNTLACRLRVLGLKKTFVEQP